MSNTLYTAAQSGLTLEKAIETYAEALGANAVGLLYAPSACQMARLTEKILTGPNGKELNLNGVYEARVFSSQAELRWFSSPGEGTKAVLISEDALPGLSATMAYQEALEQKYLLWGSVKEARADGWSCLIESRLGSVTVPLNCMAKQTVTLTAREYIGVSEGDTHGNVVVLEELLRELQVSK